MYESSTKETKWVCCASPAVAAAPGKGTSGVDRAMGAAAPARSAKPRKGEWAGEARASRSPSPAGGGVAAAGASGAPFSFFAAGASLLRRSNRQASSAEQETRDRGSSTYRSSPESSSGLLPNLKPENRLEGRPRKQKARRRLAPESRRTREESTRSCPSSGPGVSSRCLARRRHRHRRSAKGGERGACA